MKFMSVWTLKSENVKDAAARFLAGEGQPAAGVTILGRWHKTDCSGGYVLYEGNDPAALYESAAVWMDLLEIHSTAVVEDAQAGPILAKVFQKK